MRAATRAEEKAIEKGACKEAVEHQALGPVGNLRGLKRKLIRNAGGIAGTVARLELSATLVGSDQQTRRRIWSIAGPSRDRVSCRLLFAESGNGLGGGHFSYVPRCLT